jgi:hypothetical protein
MNTENEFSNDRRFDGAQKTDTLEVSPLDIHKSTPREMGGTIDADYCVPEQVVTIEADAEARKL